MSSALLKVGDRDSAIIDAEDLPRLSQYTWRLHRSSSTARARRIVDDKYLHHVVLGYKPTTPYEVDHINGNGLDNRKCNLRVCTRQQNMWNSDGHCNRRSKYKGVCFHLASGLWRSRLNIGGHEFCNYHKTEEAAANAYNKMAMVLHGKFAKLNYVQVER